MGAVTVDQAKLVMNTFMTVFEDNLVAGKAFAWNEHEGELDDRNALTVVEQVGPRYKITRTQNGVKDLSAGTDGTVFGSEQFKIDGTFNANMGWGDFIKIRDLGSARESKALQGAATSLAEQIDAYILGIATMASNNWTFGALGVNPASMGTAVAQYADVAMAYNRIKEEGVGDNDLSLILSHYDEGSLGDAVISKAALTGIASDVYRRGFDKSVAGQNALFTNQLPTLTTGTRAAMVINGAAQNVNYASVAVSSAPGRFLTQTIAVDGLGAAQTVKAGETFFIPGVFAFDQRKQAAVNPARLQQFTVTEDAVADGGGAIAALRIFPAMIVPGSGAGDNININSAHATVTAAPADNAVVTLNGAANTTYGPRLLVQKEAISIDTIQLIMPATGIAMRRKLSNIPLSVRMWQHSDFNTGAHNVRFDVAMNANVRDRRRMVRLNGGATF